MLQDLLRPGDFMTKVDLKDAHFMIPIAREYCRRPAKVAAFCMAGKDVSVQLSAVRTIVSPAGFYQDLKGGDNHTQD